MSAISSYASETPATGDKLLGTDVTDGGTHNFTVDALKTFYSAAPTFTGAVDLGAGGVTIGNADLAINTSAFSVDGSASKAAVGLGTGLGDGTLHVHTATAGTVAAATTADDLVIENSTSAGMSILTPNTVAGTIFFGDPEDNNVAEVSYNHSTDAMSFWTNATYAMTIDSTQKVGVNQASPDGTLHVHTATAGTVTAATTADDLVIENSTSAGLSILTPNTVAGTIFFGDPEDNNVAEVSYDHSTNAMSFWTNATVGWQIEADQDLVPGVTESYDIGSAGLEVDNIYTQNAVTVSDERRKENIVDISDPLDFVNALRPVQYTLKDTVVPEVPAVLYEAGEVMVAAKVAVYDEDGNVVEAAVEEVLATGGEVRIDAVPEKTITHSRPHTGFIAQEVKTAMGANDWAGYAYDEDADVHMLRLNEFVGYLVGAVKELTARVVALEV